ncbi:MAG: NAD-dependent epimerase/dehydratase family protein, partial [Anaerolineae bacterium]
SLVVFGDGTQTRDYVYIDDVVDALVAAATAPDVNRQVINVGSGQETSVNQLVGTIERVVGRSVQVLYVYAQSGGVSRLVADLTRARQLLNYTPRVDLATGLQLLLEQDHRFAALRARR